MSPRGPVDGSRWAQEAPGGPTRTPTTAVAQLWLKGPLATAERERVFPKTRRGYSEKEPPVRDEERLIGVGTLKYDTTTDGALDASGVPQIMVAYKDAQACADFLVTYVYTS